MAKRKQYPSMINCAYSIAFFLYISMSIAGYSMFGGGVLQEITLNLKPGVLSHAAVLMTIINPVTKFALTLNPSETFSFTSNHS
jgi:vesicular inhibitory amino acid transporter